MKEVKTTITGLIAALALVSRNIFAVEIPQSVIDGVVAIALFLNGFFSKDA